MSVSVPRMGLSLQFVTAEALNVDWSSVAGEYAEGYRVVLPRPTYGRVREINPGTVEQWEADASDEAETAVKLEDDALLSDDHFDDFESSDAYYEWRDGYEPVMNYAWPVSLGYGGPSADEAAQLIDEFGGACSLIEFDEENNPFGSDSDAPEYAIALTGGGMDLSDNIAAAYLCCGCVPPERILSGLDNFTGCNRSGYLSRVPIAEAFERAADYFRSRADRLDEVRARMAAAESGR